MVMETRQRTRRAGAREEEVHDPEEQPDPEMDDDNQSFLQDNDQQEEPSLQRDPDAGQDGEGALSDDHSQSQEGTEDLPEEGSLANSSQPSDREVHQLPIDDLVFLGPRCCRASMTINVNGIRVPAVCGRTIDSCGRSAHQRRRADGEVNPVGAYTRLEVPRGFQSHGQSGLVYYTQEEWEARNQPDLSPRQSRERGERILREAEARMHTSTHQGSAQRRVNFAERSPSPPGENDPLYGLEGADGARVIVTSQQEVYHYQGAGFHLKRIFPTRALAEVWKREQVVVDLTTDRGRRREQPRHRQASPDPSGSSTSSSSDESSNSDSSSTYSSSSESTSSRRQRRRSRKAKRKSKKRSKKKNRPTQSQIPPVIQTTKPFGPALDLGRHQAYLLHQGLPEAKTSRKKEKKIRSALHGPDPSEGKDDTVYGGNINDDTLMKALAPKGSAPSDGRKLFENGVDVVGLPGMYGIKGNQEGAVETERMSLDMTGALRAMSGELGAPILTDPTWNAQARHILRTIKNRDDLIKLVQRVIRVKENAFKQQNHKIRILMRGHRHEDIVKYQQRGGLTIITRGLYDHYLALLQTVQNVPGSARELTEWKSSHAGKILEFHSENLLLLRTSASNKSSFILQCYCYLRDYRKNKFMDAAMLGDVWERLEVTPVDYKGSPNGAKDKENKCNHCRNSLVHTKFGRLPVKAGCPFRNESSTKARAAAAKAQSLLTDSPNMRLEEVLQQALEAVS